MRYCSIITCKNTTKNVGAVDRDLSFHCFPDDPLIKNKWIVATGRKKWFPTKNNRICSAHFQEYHFNRTPKYTRLINTAYPTIDVVIMSNNEKIKDQPSSERDSINNMPRKRKLEKDINEPSISDEISTHTPKMKEVLNQLKNARLIIEEKDKQIKRLKEQNRRKVIKIHNLEKVLTRLKNKILISDEQSLVQP